MILDLFITNSTALHSNSPLTDGSLIFLHSLVLKQSLMYIADPPCFPFFPQILASCGCQLFAIDWTFWCIMLTFLNVLYDFSFEGPFSAIVLLGKKLRQQRTFGQTSFFEASSKFFWRMNIQFLRHIFFRLSGFMISTSELRKLLCWNIEQIIRCRIWI